jgi:hypothetical protein
MATLRQYYETDFDYALRVKVTLGGGSCKYEGAIFFDASANSAFLASYFSGDAHTYDSFTRFLRQLNYGSSGVNLDGGIILPSIKQFPGQSQSMPFTFNKPGVCDLPATPSLDSLGYPRQMGA